MSRGKLFGGFLGDFERFVCTDSGRLSKPVKGREYKLILSNKFIGIKSKNIAFILNLV